MNFSIKLYILSFNKTIYLSFYILNELWLNSYICNGYKVYVLYSFIMMPFNLLVLFQIGAEDRDN